MALFGAMTAAIVVLAVMVIQDDASEAPKPTPTTTPVPTAADTPVPTRASSTTLYRYAAPQVDTVTLSGECFFVSFTSQRSDAWRCSVSSGLYDPCFPAPGSSVVVCPEDPRSSADDVVFRNVGDRPASSVATVTPWFIVLENGAVCSKLSTRQLPSSSAGRSVFGCKGGLLCTESQPGQPYWTTSCFNPRPFRFTKDRLRGFAPLDFLFQHPARDAR